MCLIAWAWRPGAPRSLLLAANRDEWLQRPAEPMHWWPAGDRGTPPILAGRDLLAGGIWLGLRRDGLFAALTNVREAAPADGARPSRGQLALRFLQGRHPCRDDAPGAPRVEAWAAQLHERMHEYAGFNLLLGDLRRGEMAWISNRGGTAGIAPGVHGLSNAALDTPWPKVRRLKAVVEQRIAAPDDAQATDDFEQLLAGLRDRQWAHDSELPPLVPGLSLPPDWNRGLSAPFIELPEYGTRCSTLVRVDADANVQVLEVQHRGDAQRREFAWNWRTD